MMIRIVSMLAVASMSITAHALSPVPVDSFLANLDMSSDVKIATWSGRGDLCMQKAKETGYLMLWVLYEPNPMQPTIVLTSVKKFFENDLCRQKFCDLINDYQYIILCCENYNNTAVYNRKNAIYGYPDPNQILNESTGQYERNHNGYPVHMGGDSYCDHAPSIHLLKFDSSANVIFHVCAGISYKMVYDEKFSPYASRFPIPQAMCTGTGAQDEFAPWLKLYLDMYPVAKQIETYGNSGAHHQTAGTNYIYDVVEIAVTETANPTVYQIAQHRDNLLFRAVTTLTDILVKRRIEDNFSMLYSTLMARNDSGKWFINHDDTLSAISSEISSGAKLQFTPIKECKLEVNQRIGSGFSLSEYGVTLITNVYNSTMKSEIGSSISVVVTNVETVVSDRAISTETHERGESVSKHVVPGRMYVLSVGGNSTFDILSTSEE